MRKIITGLLVLLMTFILMSCSSDEVNENKTFKVGMVCIGDNNEFYTAAHVEGLNAAAKKYGVETVYKYNAGEGGEKVQTALEDLVEEDCDLIISNSYGHQSYTLAVAQANPDIYFVASTGDNCANAKMDKFANAFCSSYESRYVAGVVAGMKLQELLDNDKLSADNFDENGKVVIGYVSAYPYAECISGYTSYYLGVKSVVSDVVMYVVYTSSWSDAALEKAGAEALLAKGAVIISQHADTVGAPSAVEAAHSEQGKEVYCVGYNGDMLSVAPTSCLTSAGNNWEIPYSYFIEKAMAGEKIEDWNGGYPENANFITPLGQSCAPGTAEKIAQVEAAIKDGSLHVFDVSTFTIDGNTPEEILADLDGDFVSETNCVADGYFHESEYRSAPYFAAAIDGIFSIDE